LPSKITLSLEPESVISYRTPGGGGYGPAIEREPEAVLWDVTNGKVSSARARDVYGVVIDGERREIDWNATHARREQMRSVQRKEPAQARR